MLKNNLIDNIVDQLKNGNLVLMPTDTIWGIVCDATNDKAISKLLKLKEMAVGDGLITIVSSYEMLINMTKHIHPKIDMMLQYLERPVTAIYDNVIGISNLASNNNTFAIRIVNDEFCKQIIESFGKPLIATSASVKTENYPAYFGKINSDILQGVDFIVKVRHDEKTPKSPSPIVYFDENNRELTFIRE